MFDKRKINMSHVRNKHKLSNHAPCKKNHARDNQMSFFFKELSNEIMTGTKLGDIFLQNRSEEKKSFVSVLRKTKKKYYENL